MTNIAKKLITPDRSGVFRTVFLYVGQGDATIMAIPKGSTYEFVLIDTNEDRKAGGIDVKKMLDDLLDDNLTVFINTHPHNDHIKGLKGIHEKTPVQEVWHSGHIPGKDHDDPYQEMMDVIRDIGEENEYFLFGTNSENKIRESKDSEDAVIRKLGDIDYIVLSPAEYVADDVDSDDPDSRYNRIHERCGVIKFSYGSPARSIMLTGDSDKKAWKEHITDYHEEKLPSDILRGSHHGSRTFFMDSKEDEDIYEDHVEAIGSSYTVISAPKKTESRHNHPHQEAMTLYKKYLDSDEHLLHLGKNRESVIVDIFSDGTFEVTTDKELVKTYGFSDDDNGKSGVIVPPYIPPRRNTTLDDKPSGEI